MADSLNRRVVGYGYQPNVSTEYRRFNSEYYSGSDVRIYFGDIWVDEINNLQYTLQENVAPIYGYCSTTWDKVARGTRMIQGSFTINYKESYYLHSVMDRLESNMKDEDEDGYADSSGFNEETFISGSTIEHLLSANNIDFNVIADEFEKSLWGKSSNATINAQRDQRQRNTYFNGTNDSKIKDAGFNILVAYGPMNEADGRKVNETVHSLVGVQLTGVSQVIDGSGRPIEEQYTFIAKDLDANVSDSWGTKTPKGPGGQRDPGA